MRGGKPARVGNMRTAVRHGGLQRALRKQLDRAAVVHLDLGELDRLVGARAKRDRVHLWRAGNVCAECRERMRGVKTLGVCTSGCLACFVMVSDTGSELYVDERSK